MKKLIIIGLMALIGGGLFGDVYPAPTNTTFTLTVTAFDVRKTEANNDGSWDIITDVVLDKELSNADEEGSNESVKVRTIRADVTVFAEEIATAAGIDIEVEGWEALLTTKPYAEVRVAVITAAQMKVIALVMAP